MQLESSGFLQRKTFVRMLIQKFFQFVEKKEGNSKASSK